MDGPKQLQSITHIDYRRLLDLASGRLKIEDREQEHLDGCRVCQSVYVYLNELNSQNFESEDDVA